jgi:hypothetical protein
MGPLIKLKLRRSVTLHAQKVAQMNVARREMLMLVLDGPFLHQRDELEIPEQFHPRNGSVLEHFIAFIPKLGWCPNFIPSKKHDGTGYEVSF